MKITIEGKPKEIADLVLALQCRREGADLKSSLEVMTKVFDLAICDTGEE